MTPATGVEDHEPGDDVQVLIAIICDHFCFYYMSLYAAISERVYRRTVDTHNETSASFGGRQLAARSCINIINELSGGTFETDNK